MEIVQGIQGVTGIIGVTGKVYKETPAFKVWFLCDLFLNSLFLYVIQQPWFMRGSYERIKSIALLSEYLFLSISFTLI